jgi:hypothetical protein
MYYIENRIPKQTLNYSNRPQAMKEWVWTCGPARDKQDTHIHDDTTTLVARTHARTHARTLCTRARTSLSVHLVCTTITSTPPTRSAYTFTSLQKHLNRHLPSRQARTPQFFVKHKPSNTFRLGRTWPAAQPTRHRQWTVPPRP